MLDTTATAQPSREADQILAIIEEMTPEQLEELEAAAIEEERIEEERRVALGQLLVKHRNAAVTYRITSGIERQWQEDQAYYEGRDGGTEIKESLLTSAKDKEAGNYKSKVFLNITRPYVETAASKVIEVLAPADERSWSLSPSSVPNMPEKPSPLVVAAEKMLAQAQAQQQPQVGPDGQPVQAEVPPTPLTPLEEAMKAAHLAARGAEIWIDDKLQECQFQAVLRAVVDEASRLGTGVVRGPVPTVRRTFKVTEDGSMTVCEEIVPESRKVSVWDAYPDPACGDNIHDGQFFIEHDRMVEKQVRDLVGQPGYIDSALLSVIEEGPRTNSVATQAMAPHDSLDPASARFHVWYYYGFLKREDVAAMGCDTAPEDEIANIGVPVIVTIINDTPVKAHLNPMSDGRFPYDFMCWQKVAGSPFGIGIARQIRPCQAILNSHVRAMMENAGLCSGPQIVLARGSIIPADGKWVVTPRKVWLLKPDADIQNVNEAITSILIPSVQQELLQAIDFALKMAENVTGLPILLQGQQGANGVPETVGGMQILVANASSLLRRMARIFDDSLITPHIRGYYAWMMAYADDDSIKGDFKVVAHGSSALVVRDQRNMFMTQTAPQMLANPAWGIDPTKLFKEIAKVAGVTDPAAIQFTADELFKIQSANQQVPDPRVQAAQVTGQTRLQVADMQNQTAQLRIARDTDRDTAYVEAETTRTQVSAEIKMAELQMRERLAMLEYANKNNITLETLKAKLMVEAGRNDLARELATLPTVKDVAETLRPGDQVNGSANEPPGQAPSGMGGVL